MQLLVSGHLEELSISCRQNTGPQSTVGVKVLVLGCGDPSLVTESLGVSQSRSHGLSLSLSPSVSGIAVVIRGVWVADDAPPGLRNSSEVETDSVHHSPMEAGRTENHASVGGKDRFSH